jgi:hypothetical protein
LIGPGRWGTTTPSLGVPVHFRDISFVKALVEVAYPKAGMMPEVSFGSHFFQDLVEGDIFYAAVYDGDEHCVFRPDLLRERTILQEESGLTLCETPGLRLYADVTTQRMVCYFESL